ncbi:MAG: type IV pilin protein [Acidobacteriota bacterium]
MRVRVQTHGASVVELLLAVAILGILLALSVTAYQWGVVVVAEKRAIKHMRTMVTAQTAHYALHGRFGTWEQLIDQLGLLDGFQRRLAGVAASEVIGDGWYSYSLRFEANAAGFTLDADPLPAYARRCRRFRYRLRTTVTRSRTGLILVALPSEEQLPESAYQPFNP